MKKHSFKELLSDRFVQQLIDNEQFIDARKGGLLLGNFHFKGGVFFVYRFPEGFRVMGEAEGWEYFLNWEASNKYRPRIREINDYNRDQYGSFKEYNIPENISIIDARLNDFESKYILCDPRGGFAIINKFSTQKHLQELEELNRTGLEVNSEVPYEYDRERLQPNKIIPVEKRSWFKRLFRL
ncbi:hypothetical protein HX017_15560 [Myroides marinus]|uniref:hypothetical protein n=1 Tax=Myroides marinus TaxID=703342 RepID=UPI0025755DE7|nr:hypothetical protein [Myroides marinus]MDM1366358.1 hypothetical protein [Myroides marinus]